MEEVKIRRVKYNQFCIVYEDVCVEINPSCLGFAQIAHYFPVIKATHGIACGKQENDTYHP